MSPNAIYNELNKVNHSLEKRLYYSNLVLNNPELMHKLLDILFMVDDKMSPRAAWIIEFTCSMKISSIIPHLDRFTANIHKVHIDSAVRPVAKICETLAIAYASKTNIAINQTLNNTHKERIIETCFDYMINDGKVASKAYGMTTLFLLGKEYDWVHPELKTILEKDFHTQSAAFKARAKQILKKLKKVS